MKVEWSNRAYDSLVRRISSASKADQALIEASALRITEQLAIDPFQLGESRNPNERDWFEDPLVVE